MKHIPLLLPLLLLMAVPAATQPSGTLPLLPHSQITIEGDLEFLLPGSGVVGGLGTEDAPFIIAGWDIQGSAESPPYAIHIQDTKAHVIIGINDFHDPFFDLSILLHRASNVTLSMVSDKAIPPIIMHGSSVTLDGIHLPQTTIVGYWGSISMANATLDGGAIQFQGLQGPASITDSHLSGDFLHLFTEGPIHLSETTIITQEEIYLKGSKMTIRASTLQGDAMHVEDTGSLLVADSALSLRNIASLWARSITVRSTTLAAAQINLESSHQLDLTSTIIDGGRIIVNAGPVKATDLALRTTTDSASSASISGANIVLHRATAINENGWGVILSADSGIDLRQVNASGPRGGISAKTNTGPISLVDVQAIGLDYGALTRGGSATIHNLYAVGSPGLSSIRHETVKISGSEVTEAIIGSIGVFESSGNVWAGGIVLGNVTTQRHQDDAFTGLTGFQVLGPSGNLTVTSSIAATQYDFVQWPHGAFDELSITATDFTSFGGGMYLREWLPGPGKEQNVTFAQNTLPDDRCRFAVQSTIILRDNTPDSANTCLTQDPMGHNEPTEEPGERNTPELPGFSPLLALLFIADRRRMATR